MALLSQSPKSNEPEEVEAEPHPNPFCGGSIGSTWEADTRRAVWVFLSIEHKVWQALVLEVALFMWVGYNKEKRMYVKTLSRQALLLEIAL